MKIKCAVFAVLAAAALLPRSASARVNLWPLVYSEGGTTSVAWPIAEFGGSCNRIFPVFWKHDFFCLFPELWFTSNGFAVLPLVANYDFKRGCVFPVFWWNTKADDYTVFPLAYSHHGYKEQYTFWALAGMTGYRLNEDGALSSHWMLPLYYRDSEERFITALYGQNREAKWLFPFCYWSEDELITLLYGRGKESEWLFPCFHKTDKELISLPYICKRDDIKKVTRHTSLPLLTSLSLYDDGRRDLWAGLYCDKRDAQGDVIENMLFPFYNYDGKKDEFQTLIFGSKSAGNTVYRWWTSPLLGIASGRRHGGWVLPFYRLLCDENYGRDFQIVESGKLPDDLTFREVVKYQTNRNDTVSCYTNVVPSRHIGGRMNGEFCLLSDNDGSVSSRMENRRYVVSARRKTGNRLLFGRSSYRESVFDVETRERVRDGYSTDVMALCGFFMHESKRNNAYGKNKSETRILWKLWHSRKTDESYTLDVFPGFSYDSYKKGYRKIELFGLPVWQKDE